METTGIKETGGLKANLLNRFLAKLIDGLVVAALYEVPLQVSFIVGVVYLSLADGFPRGSLGKRMIGLRVILREGNTEASFRESIIRNAPFVVAYFLYTVPFIGWLMTLGIIGLESFIVLGNPEGIRCGDELAGTQVLNRRRGVVSLPDPVSDTMGK